MANIIVTVCLVDREKNNSNLNMLITLNRDVKSYPSTLFVQVFYWTHNLFFLWYILLILHGGDFWKWFLVPAILYILERILRSKWVKLARYGRTYIQEGILLPSKVHTCCMYSAVRVCCSRQAYSQLALKSIWSSTLLLLVYLVTMQYCSHTDGNEFNTQ